MTTKMEKKMIGAFYTLTKENIELHKQIAALKNIAINERRQYNELLRAQCDGYGPEYDTEEFACGELASEWPDIEWEE